MAVALPTAVYEEGEQIPFYRQAAAALVTAALLVTAVPAARAAGVDPVVALRV